MKHSHSYRLRVVKRQVAWRCAVMALSGLSLYLLFVSAHACALVAANAALLCAISGWIGLTNAYLQSVDQ